MLKPKQPKNKRPAALSKTKKGWFIVMKNFITAVVFTAVLLIAAAACSSDTDLHFNSKDKTAKGPCFDEPIDEPAIHPKTVQDLFRPMDIMVLSHNAPLGETPQFIRFYPFGEIADPKTEGKASFVIFIDEGYRAEQQANLLRLIPADDSPPNPPLAFMEITQAPNITLEEAERGVMSSIDFGRYSGNYHGQPTERFPFIQIRFWDGGTSDSMLTNIYIRDNEHGGVFIITTQHTFASWHHASNFRNALETFKIISEPGPLAQDLPEPIFAMIFMEGMPELVRYYPFSQIAEPGTKGMASYIIYFEDFYQVEQKDSLLRATPAWSTPADWPELFMEITQAQNTTAEQTEQRITADFDPGNYYFYHQPADEHFPFTRLIFESREPGGTITSIYIKDNTQGGVFIITARYPIEAAEGHGARFLNSLKTLSIIEP
jgi:hypothetical protein